MPEDRDPKVSQHYRGLEPMEPPAALDRKILDAARAAESPHAPLVVPAGRHRWYYSLAAAAVLVFAVALTVHLERERPDAESVAPGPPLRLDRELRGEIKPAPKVQPTPQAQPERPPAFAPDPRARVAPTPRAADTPPAQERMLAEQAAANAAAKQAQANAERRREAEATLEKATAARSMAAAPAQQRQDAGAPARQNVDVLAARREAAQVAAAPENPERWLERIAELRSRGRHADADRELAAFRKAYPDYRLSDLMRERVEGTPTPTR